MSGRSWRLIVLLPAFAGCDLPGKPRPESRPAPAESALDFATLYGRNCAGCHGAHGRLGPAPPLNDPLFLQIVPESELVRVIAEGRPGTPMPAFAQGQGGPLTEAQVRALAAGIKPQWSQPGKPKVPDAPSYATTAAAATRANQKPKPPAPVSNIWKDSTLEFSLSKVHNGHLGPIPVEPVLQVFERHTVEFSPCGIGANSNVRQKRCQQREVIKL